MMADGGDRYWIGLHDVTTEGQFEWIDGSEFSLQNWYPNEPNDWGVGEDCTEVRPKDNMKWNDMACTSSFKPLCRLGNIHVPPVEKEEPYFEVLPGSTNWHDAEDQCVHWGGHLATYQNAEEEAALQKVLNDDG